MGKIVNVRIDGRLIHGQVCTQWVHQVGARKIFIIDDIIAKDAFLSQICVMASPADTTLECISTADAAKRWNENELGTNDPIFILFQTLDMAIKAWDAGFHYPTLNFGTTLNKAGMIPVGVGSIQMKPEQAPKLQEMQNGGCMITFQVTPGDPCSTWNSVRDKNFPDVK